MQNLKCKMQNLLVVLVIGLTMLSLAKPAAAFWPFDFFKGKSEAEEQVGNGFPALIQKLIDKFSLNTDEVKQVMEEHREEEQKKGQENFEERLNEAIEEGKITEEQKQAILEKRAEMQAERGKEGEALKDLSSEERREKMKAHQEEMKAWAEENGIEMPMLLGGPGQGGLGRPHPHGDK